MHARLTFAIFLLIVAAPAHADREQGREVFRSECIACHAIACNKAGPKLGGVLGRQAGSLADFRGYSDEMRSADFVWTVENLDAFIGNPDAVVPGNGMAGSFGRLEDAAARADLIEFLEEPDESLDVCF